MIPTIEKLEALASGAPLNGVPPTILESILAKALLDVLTNTGSEVK